MMKDVKVNDTDEGLYVSKGWNGSKGKSKYKGLDKLRYLLEN